MMKKGLFVLIMALLSVAANAQNKISKLDIQGCDITLVQADAFSYRIAEGHFKLIDIILTGNKLAIINKNSEGAKLPITVYITNIDELSLSNSQLDYSGSFGNKKLKLDMSASSDVILKRVDLNELAINTSSSSRLKLLGKAKNIMLDASSSSECNISVVANKIKIDASSSANVNLVGESKLLVVDASSLAHVDASLLQTKQVNSSHSTGGGIKALAQLPAANGR